MTRKTLFVLILAALVAVPTFAGSATVVIHGEIRNASEVVTESRSVGAPSARTEAALMTIDTGGASALVRFTGEILEDGTIRVENRRGPATFVHVGDAVTVRAAFTCPRPGSEDACHLRALRIALQ